MKHKDNTNWLMSIFCNVNVLKTDLLSLNCLLEYAKSKLWKRS